LNFLNKMDKEDFLNEVRKNVGKKVNISWDRGNGILEKTCSVKGRPLTLYQEKGEVLSPDKIGYDNFISVRSL
jgi:hypothetical protein